MLRKLAQYDINMQIKTVQELYMDYYTINSNVFHLNIDSCIPNLSMKSEEKWNKYDEVLYNRIYDGILSICLSNRLFPIIKCVKGSKICSLLSQQLSQYYTNNYNFIKKECGKDQNGILFLFDRKEDPVTPLINQWTYQAMLHEIIGIKNNVITLKSDGIKKEESYVISDIEQVDKFFSQQMNNDYGAVAKEVEKEADRLKQENSQMNKDTTSLEELRKIIDSLPEKKKESMSITKHYKLFYQLCEYVNSHKLMELSPIEQDIACNNNKKDQLNKIISVLQDPKVSSLDKAKLYLLYIFRYENDQTLNSLKEVMNNNKMSHWVEYGDLLIEYAGKNKRVLDVLSNRDFLSMGKKFIMNAFGNNNNVFMQHVSYLSDLIDRLVKGRISENEVDTMLRYNNSNVEGRPNKIIVFCFGGITFEECKDLTSLSKQLNIPIICGGTNILNSKSFLAELQLLKNDNLNNNNNELIPVYG